MEGTVSTCDLVPHQQRGEAHRKSLGKPSQVARTSVRYAAASASLIWTTASADENQLRYRVSQSAARFKCPFDSKCFSKLNNESPPLALDPPVLYFFPVHSAQTAYTSGSGPAFPFSFPGSFALNVARSKPKRNFWCHADVPWNPARTESAYCRHSFEFPFPTFSE